MILQNFKLMRQDSQIAGLNMEHYLHVVSALRADPGHCCCCARPIRKINLIVLFWNDRNFLIGGLCPKCERLPEDEVGFKASKPWFEDEFEILEVGL